MLRSAMKTAERKKNKAIKELLDILSADGLNVDVSDDSSSGKAAIGDLQLQFKRRKYPLQVERRESIPNSKLEDAKADSDILLFRKNRENWKVYMDMNTLLLLMLNRRS